jgi:hypothetical protein
MDDHLAKSYILCKPDWEKHYALFRILKGIITGTIVDLSLKNRNTLLIAVNFKTKLNFPEDMYQMLSCTRICQENKKHLAIGSIRIA